MSASLQLQVGISVQFGMFEAMVEAEDRLLHVWFLAALGDDHFPHGSGACWDGFGGRLD